MNLAEKIQEQRKKLGLSQEQLAQELGVSRQAVSKWESGQAAPETEKIIQLSRLYGVSTDYLLVEGEALPQPPATSGDNKMETIAKGMLVAGLLVTAVLWRVFQSPLALLPGLLLDLGGWGAFVVSRPGKGANRAFYRFAVWLLLPIPVLAATTLFFGYYPRPYTVEVFSLVSAALYLIPCILVYSLLKKK